MRQSIIILFISILTITGIISAQQPEVKEPVKSNARPTPSPEVKAEPFDKATVAEMAKQCVVFDTESGVIEMEMYPEHAPESVRSFLNIVSLGYLDTTTFSRVVPNFVIQGGDLYTREGKVSYEIGMRARKTLPDEPNKMLHERGILSMARTEEPNTATTNFFILVGEGSHLNNSFAAFGRVSKGMDVVDAINKAPATDEKPEKPVRIKKASITTCITN